MVGSRSERPIRGRRRRMQDWLEEFESVGRRVVESDDRVASTEGITKAASPDWAVTLHDGRQVTAEVTCMTEPGMNLQQEQLATGRQHSPGGRWFLDVRRQPGVGDPG